MPDPTRSIFLAICKGEQDIAEMARERGISHGDVVVHLAQALRILEAAVHPQPPP